MIDEMATVRMSSPSSNSQGTLPSRFQPALVTGVREI